MCYILVKLDNSPESLTALKNLVETADREFELSIDEPQLRFVLFGSDFLFCW